MPREQARKEQPSRSPSPPAEKAPDLPAMDAQTSAFAKFFKRAGKEITQVEKELEEKARQKELEEQERREREDREEAERQKQRALENEKAREIEKAKEKEERAKEKAAAAEAAEAAKAAKEKEKAEKAERAEKPEKPQGFGLPPPGTVTKKGDEKAAGEAKVEEEKLTEEEENKPVQEVSPLDHRYVGLVIGKAGDTIKSFKKQSGASIEIDQNLPDAMPRMVIYRGTRKQVTAAKKLVDGLVLRAKEDEKGKSSGAAAPAAPGMGIFGRGPAGDKEGPEDKKAAAAAEEDGKVLPPWRRMKPDEPVPSAPGAGPGQPGGGAPGAGVASADARPARPAPNPRRDMPWTKREKEPEAAAAGSLTGSLTGPSNMRPAWMKSSRGAEAADEASNWDRSVWAENKYSKQLLLMAKAKILRGKAYEIPAEMMTITTGVRPKYQERERPKKDKDDELGRGDGPPLSPADGPEDGQGGDSPRGGGDEASEAPAKKKDKEKSAKKEKKEAAAALLSAPGAGTPYENLPGDSKDILKLKKKLREILKIEDIIAAGMDPEPNQVDKMTKKAQYLEELRTLESIVHNAGLASNGS